MSDRMCVICICCMMISTILWMAAGSNIMIVISSFVNIIGSIAVGMSLSDNYKDGEDEE